jgi:hypothetical protein
MPQVVAIMLMMTQIRAQIPFDFKGTLGAFFRQSPSEKIRQLALQMAPVTQQLVVAYEASTPSTTR